MKDDKDYPLWQKLGALALFVIVVAICIIFANRLGADFWPLDSSRVGPNIVASVITWAVVVITGILLYPPWRRRAHKFLDAKFDKVHAKLDEHHRHQREHAEWMANQQAKQMRAQGIEVDPHPHFDLAAPDESKQTRVKP